MASNAPEVSCAPELLRFMATRYRVSFTGSVMPPRRKAARTEVDGSGDRHSTARSDSNATTGDRVMPLHSWITRTCSGPVVIPRTTASYPVGLITG